MHIHIRLMGNFGLDCGVPWHVGTNGSLCLICKQGTEDVTHFLLDRPFFKQTLIPYVSKSKPELWSKTCLMVLRFAISSVILTVIAKFCSCSGVCHCNSITRGQFFSKDLCYQQSEKFYKLHTNKLRELEALWLKDK